MAIKIGGTGSDPLTGTSLFDALFGDMGNDTFTGSGGLDLFEGWFGDDTVNGGSSSFAFDGGAGTDAVTVSTGDWAFSFQAYSGQAALSMYNYATGQTVMLSEVESVKVGSVTYKVTVAPDADSTLTGTSVTDFVVGRDGNDTINTSGGDDWIIAGGGADKIDAGSGNDIINKTFFAQSTDPVKSSTIKAGSGNDTIIASVDSFYRTAKYTIDGGTGVDVVYFNDFYDSYGTGLKLTVSSGKTTFAFDYWDYASNTLKSFKAGTMVGVEQIVELYGNKVYNFNGTTWTQGRAQVANGKGTTLSEKIVGTSGNDVLKGGGGFDHFVGGKGTDTLVLDGSVDMWSVGYYGSYDPTLKAIKLTNQFDPRSPAALVGTDIEKLTFANGSGADQAYSLTVVTGGTVTGTTDGNNFIVIGGTITANQQIDLGAGNDVLIGQGNATKIEGGVGNDIITWAETGSGVVIQGGSGNDRISLTGAMSKSSSTGTWIVDGGTGNDTISVTVNQVVTIEGGSGDDTIYANSSSKISGGSGNDGFSLYFTDKGTGTVDGGTGVDLVGFTETSADLIVVKSGAKFIVTDKFTGYSVEVSNVEGMRFADKALDLGAAFTTYKGTTSSNTASGTSGIDLMHGGAGHDKLSGGGGNDTLAGDTGNDTLDGGSGNDFLYGGTGNDTMTGGSGFDMFYFKRGYGVKEGSDVIKDFKAGAGLGDVIAFGSNQDVDSFQDVMKLASQVGNNTVITFDNGDKITLENIKVTNLVADDFHFF